MSNEKKQSLSLFDLVSMGVGCVIGAGIFSTLGTGITTTGRSIWLAMFLAMILTFIKEGNNTLLATMFEAKGGSYGLNSLVLTPTLLGSQAFITVLRNLNRSVMGISFASYLVQLLPALENSRKIIAICFISICYLVSIKGNKFMSKVQNVMCIFMYISMGLFVIYGIINRDPTAYAGEPFMIDGTTGFVSAIATMSFACSGISNVVNLTKDVENAKKKVPQALVIGACVTAVIYALLGYAGTHCMSYNDVAGQELGVVAQHIMPNSLYLFFVVGGALFALSTTLLGGIAAMKWPLLASVEDGWFPAFFGKKTKTEYPWVIMLVMYLFAIIPVIFDFSISFVVSLVVVPSAINTAMMVIPSWKIPDMYPKTFANNSWHMNKTTYHILVALVSIVSVYLAVTGLVGKTASQIASNLALTAFMYVYSYFRFKSGKVHLKEKEAYRDQESN